MPRRLMLIVLAVLISFTALSIISAFLAAEKAQAMFNSPALVVFWLVLLLLLLLGFIFYPTLSRRPGSLLMHLGCVLILLGGLWGSEKAHQLREKHLDTVKIFKGYMKIPEGGVKNEVQLKDDTFRNLSFDIGLKQFTIEYYGTLFISTPAASDNEFVVMPWSMPAEPGKLLKIGDYQVKILRTFQNFRMDEHNKPFDSPGGGQNPAVQFEVTTPEGETMTRYAFMNFPGHANADDPFQYDYQLTIPKDYKSDLIVRQNGRNLVEKIIEVNDPLHFGGYHFYQTGYDLEQGRFSVLQVVSDSGLYVVYLGFWLLCAGVFWHFWILPAVNYFRKRRSDGPQLTAAQA